MPTFKAYVNKSGYYIKARPPGVGNITYQVQPDAAEFLVEIGYADGDDLPWGLIKPLRVSGLVYTNKQGVSEDNGDVPELDPSKLSSISAHERAKLISYLEKRDDIRKRILEKFHSVLEGRKSDTDLLSEALLEKLGREVTVVVERPETFQGENETVRMEISYQSENKLDELFTSSTEVKHHIELSQGVGGGVNMWEVEQPYGNDWDAEINVIKEKIAIMEAFKMVSGRLSFVLKP